MVRNNNMQEFPFEGPLNQVQTPIIEGLQNNSDTEDSKTQELQEEIKIHYVAPQRYDQNAYYDLESLKKFEIDQTPFKFISDADFKSDLFWIENDYHFKWMDILCMVEKNLKAIILNRIQNKDEIPLFLTKKLIPFINCIMSKLILNDSQLKTQTYCNEILLMAQKISLIHLKQYPQPCLIIIKKIFCNQNERMYDSRFQNHQINFVIQEFYAERAFIGVTSQIQGIPRDLNPQDQNEFVGSSYNQLIYFPLQDEILAQQLLFNNNNSKKSQSSFYFSPFLRIQIHFFYKNEGFQILTDIINAPDWNISQIMEMLDILSAFNWLVSSEKYSELLMQVHDSLLRIPEKISEEELKNSSKEQFYTLLANLKKILQPLHNSSELDKKVGLIEMQIILLCFRSQNLEKRIYGLQQFNEKINEAINNEYLSMQYNYQGQQNAEWLVPKNILDFVLTHQVFEDLFGDKSHIELIKRSFPLVRFLYQQNKLGKEGIINLLQIAGGKHEAWVNIMYKILNEMAEVLLDQDIEAVLNEIGTYTIERIDMNVLNFIKSFGKNPIFEKAEKKALKRFSKPNQKLNIQNKEVHNNVLDEMDLESAQAQPFKSQQIQQIDKEENINNIISKNKEEYLLIKVHSNGQETQSFEYDTQSNYQKQQITGRNNSSTNPMIELKIFGVNEEESKTSRQPGDRKYNSSKVSPQQINKIKQFQDSGSEETNCEEQLQVEEQEGLSIRLSGKILLFLFDLLKRFGELSNLNNEIGKLLFQIFTHLLCNQFRFQRFNYLVISISALEDAQWVLPPTINVQIIQKILQSNYPIINPIERCLIKTQGELTRWIEHQYNFRISALGWISRIKKQCVEILFQEDVTYLKTEDQVQKTIINYLEQAEYLLKFYQLFYSLSDGVKIEQYQIKLLWQILVENALNQQEQGIFFSWLHSILYPARTSAKTLIISQECIQLIFFEYLIKIHHSSYQTSMFFCLHDLVLYFNIFYQLFKPLNDHDSYMVMSHEIIGIEAVWHLFFETDSKEISQKAQDFLLQIIKFRVSSLEIQNQLKVQYIQKIMQNIQQKLLLHQWCDQERISISRSLKLLIKLLEDLEGLKVFGMENQEKGDKITVTVDNKIKGSLPPKKQDLILYTGMTVFSVKQLVGQRLNPQMKAEEFDIVNRGNWLSDTKVLKDYKFENKLTIMICQKPKQEDNSNNNRNDIEVARIASSAPIALPFSQIPQTFTPNDELMVQWTEEKVTPDTNIIEGKIQTILDFTGEDDKDFVQFILEDKNYNEADVIDELLDKESKDDYLVKFQIKKSQVQIKQNVWVTNDCSEVQAKQSLSTMISEDLYHISTLFKVLQINDPEIGHAVWQILSLIPRNRQMYQAVENCLHEMPNQSFQKQQSTKIEEEKEDFHLSWHDILDSNNPHRLLYNIQILRELLECDVVEDHYQPEEVKHRKEGRERFVLNGGLHHVITSLMNPNYLQIMADQQNLSQKVGQDFTGSDFLLHQIKIVTLSMEIFSIYSNAYVLSKSDSSQKRQEINKLIKLGETINDVYKSLDYQSSTNYFLGGVLKSQGQVLNKSGQNDQDTLSIKSKNKSQKQSSSNSNSQTVSSLVTPNFQSIGTTPQNIPTPPNYQDDNQSAGRGSQPGKQESQSALSQKNKIDEFKQLIQAFRQEERLQQTYENIYATFFNNGDLIKHFIIVIQTLDNLRIQDISSVIELAFSIILTSIYHQPSLINDLFKMEQLTDIFLEILLRSQNDKLRRLVAFTIMTTCDMVADGDRFVLTSNDFTDNIELEINSPYQDEIFQTSQKIKLRNPRIFFLKAYIPLIEMNTDFSKCDSEDFFVVIANLLSSLDTSCLQGIVHFEELFEKVSSFILKRQINEERFGDNQDKVLQGYLLILTTILEIQPKFKQRMNQANLLENIYDFLFYMPSIQKIDSLQAKLELLKYPKCKRKTTRIRAFSLLIEACRNYEDNFIQLLDPIVNNHDKFDHNESDSSSISVKGSHGYVGLKNLGSTCYINSLLQQLFMMPQLRRKILNAQITIPNKESSLIEHSKAVIGVLQQCCSPTGEFYIFEDTYQFEQKPILKKLLIDHSLYQLQLVFTNLQESVKKCIDPSNFINSIKGYDGQQINVGIQQDVNEFFNLLTDKLEGNLKGTKHHNVLQKTMGGILGHAIVSLEKEFPFDKETDEPFLTVTIEIKGKKNLEEALDLFVKGDILEGENQYFCDQYDKKINVVKNCYFKELPDTFVITLKRFEFDYNSMVKMKINDYFEFPLEISLYKWTKEGQQNPISSEFSHMYHLVGVLIHSGCAESGHYYSFIKDRMKDQWYEFNDTHVNPFNLSNLKNECFGGGRDGSTSNDWDNNRSKSAYILIYQRSIIDQQLIEEELIINDHCLVEKVWSENLNFLRNVMFYSADYLCFVKDFICQFKFPEQQEVKEIISYDEEMLMLKNFSTTDDDSLIYYQKTAAMKVIKLMTLFSYETLMKNNDVQGFVNSMQTIQTLYDKFIPGAFWLLDFCTQRKQILIDLLFESSQTEVKNYFAKLLTQCISCVAKIEEPYLLDDLEIDSDQIQSKKSYKKSCLLRFLSVFVDQLFPLSKKNMRKTAEYFQVIKFTFMQSPKLIQLARDSGMFRNFYNFFTETLRENQTHFPLNITKLNERGLENSLVSLFEVITKIILGNVTQGMHLINEDSPHFLFKPFLNNLVKIEKTISTGHNQNNQNEILQPINNFMNKIVLQQEQLSAGDKIIIENFKIYFVPMMQINNTVPDVTRHLCWGDKLTSQRIIYQLITLILDYFINWNQTDPVFNLVNSVVRLNDEFQQERIEMVFATFKDTTLKAGSIVDAIKVQMSYDKNYSINCIKWIAEIGYHCAPFASYMVENHEIFDEMLQTLRNQRQQSGLGIMSFSQILPNIINKAISQLEQILNTQKLEWAERLIPEEPEDQIGNRAFLEEHDIVDNKQSHSLILSIDNFLNEGKIRYKSNQQETDQDRENMAQQLVQEDYNIIQQQMEDSDNESKKVNISSESIREESDFENQQTFNQSEQEDFRDS